MVADRRTSFSSDSSCLFSASDINGLINTDVFFCVVLAFGGAGYVYLDSIDEVKVPLDDIISIFKGDRCPALLCKPKVFIVQVRTCCNTYFGICTIQIIKFIVTTTLRRQQIKLR